MDNRKDDRYYARKAIEHFQTINRYTENKSYEEFISDEQLLDATMFRLIQLIENIKNISFEFKEMYSNIPWGKIMGFRNGIVHEYGKSDYTIVYEVIRKNLPTVIDTLMQIIKLTRQILC